MKMYKGHGRLMKSSYFSVLLVLGMLFFSNIAISATMPTNVTPQQLEQFKRLPESQQRALAQSMGIDFNKIKRQISSSAIQEEFEPVQNQTYPRGTKFDENGQPIIENDEEDENEDELKAFGYDVFANAPYTFAPSMDIAVPEDYLIGAGDTLSIQLFGKENDSYELDVSRQGEIVIPLLGPFKVSGLTFLEVKKYLSSEINKKVLGVETVITLANLRSVRVFVAGDAFKPGPYVLSALSSMTHALFAAGGINDIGSLRNIQLKRNGKLVSTLDLYDLLIKGDSSNDAILKSGDVVFVSPVGKRVTIDGEVTRPAIYELSEGETFSSALKMAGGLLPSAYPKSTVVERYNEHNSRTIVNIDLTETSSLQRKVFAGDVVKVMKTSEQFDQSVTVIGAVSRPGKYQWQEGQKITDLLSNIHGYMLDDADLNYSIVVREKDIGRNIEIVQFSLFKAISNPESKDNIKLNQQDRVLVFSVNDKLVSDAPSLDSMAMTQEELFKLEKEKAKLDFEDRQFWLEFGEEKPFEEVDELDESLKLAKQSMEELIGGEVNEELELKDMGLFSRQRMLAPVILKLRQQAASGEPIQLVEVVGAVKYPGVYPLAIHSEVNELIYAAGGLLESAYLDKADITRNMIADNKAKKSSINISLKESLAGNEQHNIAIKSKDRLNVHVIPAWQENHTVELRGEFMFPGKYTIQRGESLSQLIERAGGYTEYAYKNGSVFTREKLKQMEFQNILKLSESLRMEIASKSLAQKDSQSIDYEQVKLLLADLTKVTPVGRLVVDLPKLEQDDNADILLEDGDVLFVPAKQNSINVIGQVQLATSHLIHNGFDAFDYVELSGGAKQQADLDRIYVIKANGRVVIPATEGWFTSNLNNQLSPGDTVVVPLDSYFMDDLSLWATGTQIIYQAAVAIAAVAGI